MGLQRDHAKLNRVYDIQWFQTTASQWFTPKYRQEYKIQSAVSLHAQPFRSELCILDLGSLTNSASSGRRGPRAKFSHYHNGHRKCHRQQQQQ